MLCVTLGLLLALSLQSEGGSPKWNSLKVTWGISLNPYKYFKEMPRTVGDATEAGFTQDGSCNDTDAKFRGNRYIKDGDTAVMLLYDNNGFIAGIQTGIPTNLSNNYPSSRIQPPWIRDGDLYLITVYFVDPKFSLQIPTNLSNNYPSSRIQPPWIRDGDLYLITVYFVDPSNICTSARGLTEFEEEGTGTDLYLQNGSMPFTVVKLPENETAAKEADWTEGKCFVTMGDHYWYNIRSDMDCDEFVPVFLLYNREKLNGFGWAMTANLSSSRYEHPRRSAIGGFMKTVPTCLQEEDVYLSTMHIYLTKRPLLNLC